jgi:hypothetical protein
MKLLINSIEVHVIRETKHCFFVQGKTREIAIGRHQVSGQIVRYSPTFTPSQAVEIGFAETLQEGRKMQIDFVNRVLGSKK